MESTKEKILEEYFARAADYPGALPRTELPSFDGKSNLADSVRKAQKQTGEGLGVLLETLFVGGAAGISAGGIAGTTAYLAVAAFASASTGAAISGLSGAAAISATMAWLGGGALAAGGLGVAGGAAVLGGIVGLPVVIGGAAALLVGAPKLLGAQRKKQREITAATADLDAKDALFTGVIDRSRMLGATLTFTRARAERPLSETAELTSTKREAPPTPTEVAAMAQLGSIVTVALFLLSLPVIPRAVDLENLGEMTIDGVAQPLSGQVVVLPNSGEGKEMEDFVSLAIATSMSQLAKI